MGRVFINYRRDDSAPYALSVAQFLEKTFGTDNVFVDVDRLRPGEDFVRVLKDRLQDTSVMLVIIGPHWLEINVAGRRRIDNPSDWVRLEIATALSRGIRVIPLLVGKATIPDRNSLPIELRPLTTLHSITLTDGSFRYEMSGLANDLKALVYPGQSNLFASSRRRFALILAGVVSALAIGVWSTQYLLVAPIDSTVVGWEHVSDPEAYARNYQKQVKEKNEVFAQMMTVYLIPISPDRKFGKQISVDEYLEIFKIPSHSDEVVVQIRLDRGSSWLLSRQTLLLQDQPRLVGLNPEESKQAFFAFQLALQNEIDTTRHVMRSSFVGVQ